MPTITVQDANVKTLAVEIKALVIGKKQFTIAMFKQLQEEIAVNLDTWELLGEPWGVVYYKLPSKKLEWADYSSFAPQVTRWVIWQRNNELLRHPVYVESFNSKYNKEVFQAMYPHFVDLEQLFIAV